MATAQGSTIEQLFRILLHRIGVQLSPQNCQTLKFTHDITSESETRGLTGPWILQEIQSKGHFGPLRPDPLEEDLKRIERQDLVNMVKQYKKTDDFKQAQKREKQQAKKRSNTGHGSKNTGNRSSTMFQISNSAEERCGNMLSFALMHAAQSVGQTRYFLEAVMDQGEPQQKTDMTAITRDIKKDFEHLNNSLKRAITVTNKKQAQGSTPVYSVVYRKPSSGNPQNPKSQSTPGEDHIRHSRQMVERGQTITSTGERPQEPSTSNRAHAIEKQQDSSVTVGKLSSHANQEYNVLNRAENDPYTNVDTEYSLLNSFHPQIPTREQPRGWKPTPPPRAELKKSTTLPPTYYNVSPQVKKRTTNIKRSSSVITKGEDMSDVRASTLLRIQNVKTSTEHNTRESPDCRINNDDYSQTGQLEQEVEEGEEEDDNEEEDDDEDEEEEGEEEDDEEELEEEQEEEEQVEEEQDEDEEEQEEEEQEEEEEEDDDEEQEYEEVEEDDQPGEEKVHSYVNIARRSCSPRNINIYNDPIDDN